VTNKELTNEDNPGTLSRRSKKGNFMGIYTTLTFEGIVKKEYREAINKLTTYQEPDGLSRDYVFDTSEKWTSTGVDFMIRFASVSWADFIPNGDVTWNKETGFWKFETKIKNYENTYEKFFEIVPLFMASLTTCVLQCEGQACRSVHALSGGKVIHTGTIYTPSFW